MMHSKRKRRGRGEGSVFYSESKRAWIGRATIGVKPDGKPLVKEVMAQTQGGVLKKMRKTEDDAREGRIGDGAKMTTAQYLQHWLANVAKPTVELSTWASYERCLRLHLVPRIGGILLANLRKLHVEALFADLQRNGMSGGNAKKVSEVLSTALQHAVGDDSLPLKKNPAALAAKPKPEAEEIVPFTPDEIMRIRLAVMGHRLEALFALAISTGAREGELLGLGWEYVDLEDGTISIQRTLDQATGGFRLKEPKSKRGRRVVDIPRFAVQALAEHRKAMLKEGGLAAKVVFCTRTGHFISKSSFVRQVYAKVLAKAEVPYRKFHTFRHTHVSELLSRGESVVDVARRIGDRPEVILKTYAHWIPGAGKKIAHRLEEMYG
jgi:integrase